MSMTPETPLPPASQRKALRPIPTLIFSSRWLQLPLYVDVVKSSQPTFPFPNHSLIFESMSA